MLATQLGHSQTQSPAGSQSKRDETQVPVIRRLTKEVINRIAAGEVRKQVI